MLANLEAACLPAAPMIDPTASGSRPIYNQNQIAAFFDRIKLPQQYRLDDMRSLSPEDTLDYLTLLLKHFFVEIPFENLTMHYSHHRQICIHPQELFKKIVSDNNGRGGYCMENNTLFGTLLYSLGFRVYSAGARVFDGQWSGWSHMVNIVTIGQTKYHIDVGFGAKGPIVPMRLDKSGPVQPHIAPASSRLEWRNITGNTDPDQRLWIYEHRVNDRDDFHVVYCFTELEFLPSDYGIMNYYTSTSPKLFFTREVIVERKLISNRELVGSVILQNEMVKWRIHGDKEKQIWLKSEDDRVEALEHHFGIVLGPVEREAIRGLVSEIKEGA